MPPALPGDTYCCASSAAANSASADEHVPRAVVSQPSTTLPPSVRSGVPAARLLAAEGRDGRVTGGRLGGRAGTLARAVPGAAAAQDAAALGALLREGPDPAGRAQESRADGGPGGARRPA